MRCYVLLKIETKHTCTVATLSVLSLHCLSASYYWYVCLSVKEWCSYVWCNKIVQCIHFI